MRAREEPEGSKVGGLKKVWPAALVLLVGLIGTALCAYSSQSAAAAAKQEAFEFTCGEIQEKISDRLHAHEWILSSAAAFLEHRGGVTREDWRRFTERLRLGQKLPGIQGTGFSLLVPPQGLAQHTQEIRAEGFPDYQVWPPGEREVYTAVVYLEPFSERNLRAFGYDMFSEPVRREAMERARDQRAAALSGKVHLVQETEAAVQAGALMYAPVYRKEMPRETLAQRRAALVGWACSPYRMTDLMQGILGAESQQAVHLQVYDGDPTPGSLLHDSGSSGDALPGSGPGSTWEGRIVLAGRPWTLRCAKIPVPGIATDYLEAWIVLLSGSFISLLLSWLLFNLSTTRARALEMAEELTAELGQKSEEASYQRWRLACALEGTQAGTWEWNVQTGATVINERWAQLIGYTLDELAPFSLKTWEAHTHPDDLKRAVELLERHCAGELPHYECEFRMKHKDGRWIWVLDNGRVMTRTAEGEALLMFGTHIDCTARKRLEEERRALEVQVQQTQRLESLGVLAGGIAHDFNNLLQGIQGNADLAYDELPSHSRLRPFLSAIIKACSHAMGLTTQMLAYSGKGHFTLEILNLNTLVSEMSTLLESSTSKRVGLKRDLGDDLPAIEADAAQIRQVVMNLVTNASEAIGEESGLSSIRTSTIQCERAFLERVQLEPPLSEGRYVCLEVSDTGCGMDEETKAKVFEPFFTTKFTGRGLGLAAVQGIVRGHKGAIWIESQPGVGTTVKVLFPALDQRLEPSQPRARPDSHWRGGGIVLVVDDDEMIRDLATTALEQLGFSTLEAEDGAEAVALFRERHAEIKCVLLDLMMPNMGGAEAFEELRKIRAEVPVILSSGYSEEKSTEQLGGRLAGFLQKPYRLAALKQKLQEVLGGRGSSESSRRLGALGESLR